MIHGLGLKVQGLELRVYGEELMDSGAGLKV